MSQRGRATLHVKTVILCSCLGVIPIRIRNLLLSDLYMNMLSNISLLTGTTLYGLYYDFIPILGVFMFLRLINIVLSLSIMLHCLMCVCRSIIKLMDGLMDGKQTGLGVIQGH